MTLIDKAEAQANYEARITALSLASAPDLSDPVTVHVNMLRGTIAKPTVEQIIHLYGVDALVAALAPVIVKEAGHNPAPDAAKIIQNRIDTIIQEEGSWEPDTNVTNLPEWAETAVEELEGILAALTPTSVDASQTPDPVVNAPNLQRIGTGLYEMQPAPDLRYEAAQFLYKHGDLTSTAAHAAIGKLCNNGFIITRAIAALPARGVGVKPLNVLNAAWRDDLGEEGRAMYARILAALFPALAPTDAAHVNETPKSEHDADNVLTDAAQAREKAMQELIDAYEDIMDYGIVFAKKPQQHRLNAAKEKLKEART